MLAEETDRRYWNADWDAPYSEFDSKQREV